MQGLPAGGIGWWTAVLAPSALVMGSQLIPLFRRYFLVPMICVVLAGSVLADASGNLG